MKAKYHDAYHREQRKRQRERLQKLKQAKKEPPKFKVEFAFSPNLEKTNTDPSSQGLDTELLIRDKQRAKKAKKLEVEEIAD